MSNNNNFGPVWTLNSNEAAGGIMIALFIFSIPVIPVTLLGYYIGDEIIGNNFAKWGLSIFAYIAGYIYLIWLNEHKGFFYAFIAVCSEYLIFDMVMKERLGRDELFFIEFVKKIIEWGLSNT